MERVLEQLVERLKKAHGERLVSVVLYGSAAADDHQGKYSDYNILCVLERVDVAELECAEPVFKWWREQGNPAPLLLSEREVETSSDCFAIEFHDIRERHRILHGRDVIAGLGLDDRFYRAQVEHELRSKFLRLRQKAPGVLRDAELLRRLLADSISTFCVLFRHALLLTGAEGPQKKREVIQAARERFGIDAAPFEALLDLREGKLAAKQVDAAGLLPGYLSGIGKVIDVVDGIEN